MMTGCSHRTWPNIALGLVVWFGAACRADDPVALDAPASSQPASESTPAAELPAAELPTSEPPTTTTRPIPTPADETSTAEPPPLAQHPAALDQLTVETRVAPVAVRIDGTSVDGDVFPVSADSTNGELAVPPSAETVAWYEHGPSPSEPGVAVLAAHVDWHARPGAFFELATVPTGAVIVVTLADGTEQSFAVTSTDQFDKDDLPTDRIFARDGPPQLALVTCGGEFDPDSREYEDNIVVFASPR